MINSKLKGSIGEYAVTMEFLKMGFTVSHPYGDNARYDLIVDDGKKLYKVQIKYTSVKTESDSWLCRCISSKNHTTNKRLDSYENDIDIIAFYISELNQCIMFTVDEIKGKNTICVREQLPKNNQHNIILIKDHTFDNYFKSAFQETENVEAG